jgi:hemerythrin-like domain-containing protein
MLPVAPLMIEHRLIERMIKVIGKEIIRIEKKGIVDPAFIDNAVDFIRVYADRCHHGKEENILFRDLDKKALAASDRHMMEELIEDHRKGRENVAALVAAKDKYVKGVQGQVGVIIDELRFFVDFYPKHIEKEDRHFFIPVMSYLGKEEKDAMLDEEYAFDKELIHHIYTERVVAGEQGG